MHHLQATKSRVTNPLERHWAEEWFGVEWFGVEWFGVEWFGVEGFGVEGFGVEWFGVEGFDVEGFGVERHWAEELPQHSLQYCPNPLRARLIQEIVEWNRIVQVEGLH